MQGVWAHSQTPPEWSEMQELPCLGTWQRMCKRCRGFACRMSGFASHGSQSQSCSQGLDSSAAEGTPRLTQGMEQATDVHMADVQIAAVQSSPQLLDERVACIPGGAYRPFHHGSCAHGSREWTANADRFGHRVRARRSRRAVRKPRTLKQCSLGPRRKLLQLVTSLPAMRTIRDVHTRIVITNGSSDVILNPSRLRLLQPGGPGWSYAARAGL